METNDYENEYELLYMVHQGDERAFQMLVDKYSENVHYIIYKYAKRHHAGMDMQDYLQMAMIKLLQAITTYREDREASFAHFYYEILRHSMIDMYRIRQSFTGSCDFYSLSLDMLVEDGEGMYKAKNYIKVAQDSTTLHAEIQRRIKESKERLNPLEQKIVDLRSKGYTYRQVAQELHIKQKKVDNTMRKVRFYKRSKR